MHLTNGENACILQYMMNTNDIGKQFFIGADASRIVTLRAYDTRDGVLMANVFDPATRNPSNIPGLDCYWMNADNLTPLQFRYNSSVDKW